MSENDMELVGAGEDGEGSSEDFASDIQNDFSYGTCDQYPNQIPEPLPNGTNKLNGNQFEETCMISPMDSRGPTSFRAGENHLEKGKNLNGNGRLEQRRMVDITRDKPVKVTVRVLVPVRDHPKFNFVGKLLGPKGNSLKRLQEDTMTKMAILGRGSMRDKRKEEELRISGDPKFSHLQDELHVEITAFAPPAEAHARIAYALADVRRFLVPDYNDEIRQEQMWEMQILKERPEAAATNLLTPAAEPPLLNMHHPHIPAAAVLNAQLTPIQTLSVVPTSPSTSTHSAESTSPPLLLPAQHPALRGTPTMVPQVAGAGRKRPLIPGSKRNTLSPTKRTVMSILARARAAQTKQSTSYSSHGTLISVRNDNGFNGNLV